MPRYTLRDCDASSTRQMTIAQLVSSARQRYALQSIDDQQIVRGPMLMAFCRTNRPPGRPSVCVTIYLSARSPPSPDGSGICLSKVSLALSIAKLSAHTHKQDEHTHGSSLARPEQQTVQKNCVAFESAESASGWCFGLTVRIIKSRQTH